MFHFEIFITEKMAPQLDNMNTGKSVWTKWKWGAGGTGIKYIYWI